jgi:osmoprotectant transport system permease protein
VLDPQPRPVRVASGPFTEQHILNEVVSQQLAASGFRTDQRTGMSEGVQFRGLFSGQVDCMVNYSGNIWVLIMKQERSASPEQVDREVQQYLYDRHGVMCLGSLGFDNAYVFTMLAPEQRSHDTNLRAVHTLDDLAVVARRSRRRLKIGGDMQFFSRPEWRHVKEAYGLKEDWFEKISMESTRMYDALVDGQVDLIVAYSSDGRIRARRLELLRDPQRAMPPYHALLLVSRKAAANDQFVDALKPLVGLIPQRVIEDANAWVDRDKHTAAWAAAQLRRQAGLGGVKAP